jgi:hypothetical protein
MEIMEMQPFGDRLRQILDQIVTKRLFRLFAVGMLLLAVGGRVRRARAVADTARVGTSAVSLLGRVLVTALVIIGVQWVVITSAPGTTLFWVALALPALIAGHVLTNA